MTLITKIDVIFTIQQTTKDDNLETILQTYVLTSWSSLNALSVICAVKPIILWSKITILKNIEQSIALDISLINFVKWKIFAQMLIQRMNWKLTF